MRAALRRGRRGARPLLVLHARDRGDDGPARVTAVASRRVGGAVSRNRAKRVLREAARAVALPSGHDIVLVARTATADAHAADATAQLRSVIEQMFYHANGLASSGAGS